MEENGSPEERAVASKILRFAASNSNDHLADLTFDEVKAALRFKVEDDETDEKEKKQDTVRRVEGDALMPLEIPDRAADPAAGKLVYEQFCQSCHQSDGQGVLAADGIAYQYPPVWGYMSYQPGSSMHRVMKSAMWIKNNMPRGVTWENPILTDQQAIDVAAYINDDDAHVRPTSKESTAEYPYPEDKPVDYHKGPFADPFDQATHKFGPWAALRAWREENGQFTGW